VNSYPNSFLYGTTAGIVLNIISRIGTHEPLSARPFSYISTGLVLGFSIWYYDYWRRRAMEEVMIGEESRKRQYTLKALNHVRVGEEEEITNLMEYLTSSTVRE
jgi:hypothetical protein